MLRRLLLTVALAALAAGAVRAVEPGVEVAGSSGSSDGYSYAELDNLGRPGTALPTRPQPVIVTPPPPVTSPTSEGRVVTPAPAPPRPQPAPVPPRPQPVPPVVVQPVTPAPQPAPAPATELPPLPDLPAPGSELPAVNLDNLPPLTGSTIDPGELGSLPPLDLVPPADAPAAVVTPPAAVPTVDRMAEARLLVERYGRYAGLVIGLVVMVAGLVLIVLFTRNWLRQRAAQRPAAMPPADDGSHEVDALLAALPPLETELVAAPPPAPRRAAGLDIRVGETPAPSVAPPVMPAAADPLPTAPPPEPPAGRLLVEEMKYRKVYELAAQGLGLAEIAHATGFGEGEIGLALDLQSLKS